MLTLQQVLDLQAQNKITITRQYQNDTRYCTLRAYTEDGEYYLNEYCLPLYNMHTKNFNEIMQRMRTHYNGKNLEDNTLIIDDKLYTINTTIYGYSGEETVSIKPFDGQEFILLMKKGRMQSNGAYNVMRAIYKLVFATDRYPYGVYRAFNKPRKYRKSEIQSSSLPQYEKDRLCGLHEKYFVLFTQDGNHIGLFPRYDENKCFEITPENVEHLNNTLKVMFGENVFEIILLKYDEKLLTEGVVLC